MYKSLKFTAGLSKETETTASLCSLTQTSPAPASTLDTLRRSQYCHSPSQSAKDNNDPSSVCPKRMLTQGGSLDHGTLGIPAEPLQGPSRRPGLRPKASGGPAEGWTIAGQASKGGRLKLISGVRPPPPQRPSQKAASVLTHHGFHSPGSGATMPSRASHISSGSSMGSIPISLANSRISARRGRRVGR